MLKVGIASWLSGAEASDGRQHVIEMTWRDGYLCLSGIMGKLNELQSDNIAVLFVCLFVFCCFFFKPLVILFAIKVAVSVQHSGRTQHVLQQFLFRKSQIRFLLSYRQYCMRLSPLSAQCQSKNKKTPIFNTFIWVTERLKGLWV